MAYQSKIAQLRSALAATVAVFAGEIAKLHDQLPVPVATQLTNLIGKLAEQLGTPEIAAAAAAVPAVRSAATAVVEIPPYDTAERRSIPSEPDRMVQFSRGDVSIPVSAMDIDALLHVLGSVVFTLSAAVEHANIPPSQRGLQGDAQETLEKTARLLHQKSEMLAEVIVRGGVLHKVDKAKPMRLGTMSVHEVVSAPKPLAADDDEDVEPSEPTEPAELPEPEDAEPVAAPLKKVSSTRSLAMRAAWQRRKLAGTATVPASA